jgi:hypothetical protein
VLKTILIIICITLAGNASFAETTDSSDPLYSDITGDEVVVFFRTTAWLDESSRDWHVPIHGWVYEPQDSIARKKLFGAILKSEFDLLMTGHAEANFSRRLNLLIADSERDKRIVVALAGREYAMPLSGVNGHFETTLIVPADIVAEFMENGVIPYSAVVRDGEDRKFTGEVMLIDSTGLSIISDIDDTVKISNVNDRKSLLENTFLLDFAAAPDMAQLYNEWSEHGARFHFVSSSPWQLYRPLEEFLDRAGFPRSTLNLKPVRFRDETLFDLFKKGTETKPKAIEKILNTYPEREFILVGDSGEQDPEVYAAMLRKYPSQILKVYIRNVTLEAADNERFASVFENIDEDYWVLFEEPLTLILPEHSGE